MHILNYETNRINNNLPVKAFVRNGLSYDFMGQNIPITGSVPGIPVIYRFIRLHKTSLLGEMIISITSDHINRVDFLKEND